jgi:predicted  nucleic acid-binding Zn-ribbon protein
VKASPDDQVLLLDLQGLDTRLQQLAHQEAAAAGRSGLHELTETAQQLRRRRLAAGGVLEDARTELSRAESDVAVVEARIARDTERVEATSSMKDVAGLEAELASLRKRKLDLEEIELGVMERIEELEAAEAASAAEAEEVAGRLAVLEAERDAAVGALARERAQVLADREALTGRIPPDLLALYERQRQRYGAGASLLRAGVSGASGVRLGESDLASVRAAAPDDVVLCPDSNAILVRTAESGL